MKIFTKGFIVAILVTSHVVGFAAAGAMAATFSFDFNGFGAEPAKAEAVIHLKSSEQLAHSDFVDVSAYADAAKKGIRSYRMAKPSSLLKGAVASRVVHTGGATAGAVSFQMKERHLPTLSAYPNPTRGVTTLSLSQVGNDNYKIRISNTIGKIVQTIDLKDLQLDNVTEIPLNLSHLPSGVYFYSLLINEKMVETKRLVLQR
jgi:hypothetical protein